MLMNNYLWCLQETPKGYLVGYKACLYLWITCFFKIVKKLLSHRGSYFFFVWCTIITGSSCIILSSLCSHWCQLPAVNLIAANLIYQEFLHLFCSCSFYFCFILKHFTHFILMSLMHSLQQEYGMNMLQRC